MEKFEMSVVYESNIIILQEWLMPSDIPDTKHTMTLVVPNLLSEWDVH